MKIREKIEISPKKYPYIAPQQNSSVQPHTLRLEVTYNKLDFIGGASEGNLCNGDYHRVADAGGGHFSYSTQNLHGGVQNFIIGFDKPGAWPWESDDFKFSFYFFLDDSILSGCSATGWSTNVFEDMNVFTPLMSGFVLGIGSPLCVGGGQRMFLNPYIDYCDTDKYWYPEKDPVTFTIVEGGGSVSFYDYRTGTTVGQSFESLECDLSNYSLLSNSDLYDSTNTKVVVEARCKNIVSRDSTNLQPVKRKLVLSVYPSETVYSGHKSSVYISLLDESPCPIYPSAYQNVTLKVSILSGEKYGEFVNPYTEERGNTLEGIQHQDGYVRLYYDANGKIPIELDTIRFLVSASDPAIAPVEAVMHIVPGPIVVIFDPDSLSPGDTARIIIKKQNEDGSVADFPSDQAFEIGTMEGCVSGKIHTVSDSGTYFKDVPAPFIYVAANDVDSSNTRVRIRAGIYQQIWESSVRDVGTGKIPLTENQNKREILRKIIESKPNLRVQSSRKNPMKSAEGEMCNAGVFQYNFFGVGDGEVCKKKLRILDHSPWSIWPYLPNEKRGRNRGSDRPGYKPWRPFTIQVTDNNDRPLCNEKVTIQVEFTERSGGHQHSYKGAHIALDSNNYGYFFGQRGKGQKTFDLVTTADGKAIIDSFTQSQFSGHYLIKAFLRSDQSIFDTVNLDIKVPGLINFRDIINYILPTNYPGLDITTKDKYYTWQQSDLGAANHPDDLWCTTEMGANLLYVILSFYDWSASKKGGGIPITLSLNDISIPWGGKFDITGLWDEGRSHSLHRVGKSIDINYHNPLLMEKKKDPQDSTSSIGVLTDLGKQLKYYFDDKNFYQIPETTSLHFEFNGNK